MHVRTVGPNAPDMASHAEAHEAEAEDDEAPDGPATGPDLGYWDQQFADVVAGSSMAPRIEKLLRNGALAVTDYSGFDSPKEGFRIFLPRLADLMGTKFGEVHWVRSCDWGALQQKVLTQQSHLLHDGAACVFADINERVDPVAAGWCDEMAPVKGLQPDAATKRNEAIEEFLAENRTWAQPVHATSWCLVHKQRCPVHPLWAWHLAWNGEIHAAMRDAGSSHELQQRGSADRSASPHTPPHKRRKVQETCQANPVPWWMRVRSPASQSNQQQQNDEFMTPECLDRNGLGAQEAPPQPLSISVAGLSCTDYSAVGQNKRSAGLTERHHSVWMQDRRTAAEHGVEDVAFSECSDRYPVHAKQALPLAETHHTVYAKLGPDLLGFPQRRTRCFAACINRARLVWVGPHPTDVREDFLKHFGRTLRVTGDAFFVASAEEISEALHQMAIKRKTKLPADFMSLPTPRYLHRLLPPGAMQRKTAYDELAAKREHQESYLADLDHHEGFGPKPGPMFPTCLTHSCVYSYRKERLALAFESLTAQGLDMYAAMAGGRGTSPIKEIFKNLKPHECRFLAGNAMHVPTFTMWMVYVLGNCRPMDDFFQLRPLTLSSCSSADELDDEVNEEIQQRAPAQPEW